MTDRLYIEAKLRNMLDMDQDKAQELHTFMEGQTDWYAFCPKCGQKREGTLSELREAHKC